MSSIWLAGSLRSKLNTCGPLARNPTTSSWPSPISVNNFSARTSFCMSIELRCSSRREFLSQSAFGIGAFALAQLLRHDHLLAEPAGSPIGKPGENLPLDMRSRAPQFTPKANAMISLFMHGGPSHVDLFDPKPELTKNSGSDYGGDVIYSFVNRASKKLFGSPFQFEKRGQCGTEVSELLPEIAGIVDDIAVIRSMHTGHNGHEVSIRYFHGGIAGVTGRPTMGR